MQVAKFRYVHLVAGDWYLDCSHKFVPEVKESLYNNLVGFVPHVIELEKELEEDNPAPPSNEKDVALVKDKGRGRQVLVHASSQVSTRSYTKTSIQRIAALATTVVGSPTATLATLANIVAAPSHSGVTIPSVLHKTKAIAPDTSTTLSERSSRFF
jgi:hypothetical protein